MSPNEQQDSMIRNLMLHTISLREEIESHEMQTPDGKGFVKILLDIERVLSIQPLDLNRLRRNKFGISRMVDGLAETLIEKKLMSLYEEIYSLFRSSEEIEKHEE